MVKNKIAKRILIIGALACHFFCVSDVFAQTVETTIDRKDILIGEQLKYTIKASFPTQNFKVQWFSLPDSIPHFEVVDSGKVDSSKENNNTILQQTITYTSFDSGRWSTPGLPINFDPVKSDTPIQLFTDSILINIAYSPSDSTGLRDIKPIMDVKVADHSGYYVVGGLLALLLLIYLLWRYFKKQKKFPVEKRTASSPFDEAMVAINDLKQYDLTQNESIRTYHTRLSEIFRQYIGRKQDWDLLNSTSSDMLVLLSSVIDRDGLADTAVVLRTGDAVKFAKYIPSTIESKESAEKITTMIKWIEQRSKESS